MFWLCLWLIVAYIYAISTREIKIRSSDAFNNEEKQIGIACWNAGIILNMLHLDTMLALVFHILQCAVSERF